jgi:hypothetical protein
MRGEKMDDGQLKLGAVICTVAMIALLLLAGLIGYSLKKIPKQHTIEINNKSITWEQAYYFCVNASENNHQAYRDIRETYQMNWDICEKELLLCQNAT